MDTSKNTLDVANVIRHKEHERLGFGLPIVRFAKLTGIEEEDIYSEVALLLWQYSLSPRSKWDPKRGSRAKYICMVIETTVSKMLRYRGARKRGDLKEVGWEDVGTLESTGGCALDDLMIADLERDLTQGAPEEVARVVGHLLRTGRLPEGMQRTDRQAREAFSYVKRRLNQERAS